MKGKTYLLLILLEKSLKFLLVMHKVLVGGLGCVPIPRNSREKENHLGWNAIITRGA
jgi:hypothetical protein